MLMKRNCLQGILVQPRLQSTRTDVLRSTNYLDAYGAALQLAPAYSWSRKPSGHNSITTQTTPTSPPKDGGTLAELQAVNWWLSQVSFTSIGERGPTNAENAEAHNFTSYLELALHVDIITGVNLGGADADLATKASRVQAALRHLAKQNNLLVNGVPSSFAEAFKPRSSPHTILPTGLWLPSISRGVCYPNCPDIHYVALANVMRARSLPDCRLPDTIKLRAALLGKNYRAITPPSRPGNRLRWKFCIVSFSARTAAVRAHHRP